MKNGQRFLCFAVFSLVVLAQTEGIFPCNGTLNPPCSRSVYLAKFAPNTVVLPSSGPINVPVGLLPFVSWDNVNTNTCAQPSSASLTLTLTCTPVGGGAPVTVGPINISVPTPTTPGPQMNIGSPVTVTIPAGLVTSPSICVVQGTYTVNFSGPAGGPAMLSGSGDTEICLVEPSQLDDSLPRLDLRRLDLTDNGPGFTICRRGDQTTNFYLITNNDPDNSVSFDFTGSNRQVAGLPDGISAGEAPGMGVRAISSPVPGTDAFPQGFMFGPPTQLPLPDPADTSSRIISMPFTLKPKEAIIVPIAIRSFGRCADGSCNESAVKIQGQFDDGSPAVGCASTLLLVDDVPAKTPLCEMTDDVAAGPNTDGIWGPAIYLDDIGASDHVATHTIGNVENFFDIPGRATWTRGASFNDPLNPPTSEDFVRAAPSDFDGVNYTVEFFGQVVNFAPTINDVSIMGLPTASGPIDVPMIAAGDGNVNPLFIDIDLNNGMLNIDRDGSPLFNGNFQEFVGSPPPPFVVEMESVRRFVKQLDADAIQSEPNTLIFLSPSIVESPGSSTSVASAFRVDSDTLMITNQNGAPASWTAAVRGDGVTLPATSGVGELVVEFSTANLSMVPETPLAFIDITSAGAINNPLTVPVAFRVDTTTIVSVGDPDASIPQTTQLLPNYPNPFNPTTTIRYQLQKPGRVTLAIYNQLGQKIRTLVDERRTAGLFQAAWDGTNDSGVSVASGVYVYRLKTGEGARTRKMLLLH